MPDGAKKTILGAARATVGIVAGGARIDKPLLKAGRAFHKFKAKRKVKLLEKRERKKEAWKEFRENGGAAPVSTTRAGRRSDSGSHEVPITVVFDCDFEDLMFENELKSLGLQTGNALE